MRNRTLPTNQAGRFIAVGLIIAAIAAATGTVVAAIGRTNRPADDAWADGYEVGHNKGWQEGHRHSRPIVLPLRHRDRSA